MNLIHRLRDLDAWLTSYGQCLRCHRSWRTTSYVTVYWRLGTGTFLLCIECWQEVRIKADAGLILQGYAAQHLARPGDGHNVTESREILTAYGIAARFPVEVVNSGEWPTSFAVRVLDQRRRNRLGRADLSPTGERVAPPEVQPSDPAPPSVIGFVPGRVIDLDENASPEDVARFRADWEKPCLFVHIDSGGDAFCERHRHWVSGVGGQEARGWNGAGSDVDGVDLELPRG